MKHLISNNQKVRVLGKAEQKSINGGNFQCIIACYDNCLANSGGDRLAYADCLDVCLPNC